MLLQARCAQDFIHFPACLNNTAISLVMHASRACTCCWWSQWTASSLLKYLRSIVNVLIGMGLTCWDMKLQLPRWTLTLSNGGIIQRAHDFQSYFWSYRSCLWCLLQTHVDMLQMHCGDAFALDMCNLCKWRLFFIDTSGICATVTARQLKHNNICLQCYKHCSQSVQSRIWMQWAWFCHLT